MTPEQRLNRVERILGRMATMGRQARSEFRQKINILINMHIQNEEHWRAQSDELNQKINILVDTQMETTEQIKGLAAGQARTERALRRKPRNGNSST